MVGIKTKAKNTPPGESMVVGEREREKGRELRHFSNVPCTGFVGSNEEVA
jgi:hypothetical protein